MRSLIRILVSTSARCLGLAALSLVSGRILAQPASLPELTHWRPDGPIRGAVVTNGILYFGGSFSYVGPTSGGGGVWNLATEKVEPSARLNGSLVAVAPDGTGGWFVGGTFTTVPGGPQNLAHVRADGGLDETFRPNPSAVVRALYVSGDRLFVGGEFTTVAGVTSPSLVILNSHTGATNGFRLEANGAVRTFAEAGGILYLGGSFSSVRTYNGNTLVSNARNRLAAFDLTRLQVTPWGAGASFGVAGSGVVVYSIAVVGDTIYAGGDFTSAAGKPRSSLAAFDNATGASTPWNPNAQDAVGNNPYVLAVLAEPDGLYVGGNFTTVGSRTRKNLAQLAYAGVGQARENFAADTDRPVSVLASGAPGELVLGGGFTAINGVARRGMAKVSSTTGAVGPQGPRFSYLRPITAQASPGVYGYARAGDREYIGGDLTSFGGVARANLAAIDLATGLPTDWNPGASGPVSALALATQDSLLHVAGTFTNLGGLARNNGGALRLADGQPSAFAPVLTGSINAISELNGRVFYGGTFTLAGGKTRNNVAEFDVATSAVTDWAPNPSSTIETVLATANRVYVGGSYTVILGNQNFDNLTLLTAAAPARIVTNFNARANGRVADLRLVGGQLYVGGEFTQIGGQSRNRLAILNPETGAESTLLDAAIPTTSGARVNATLVAGKILYAAGVFTSVGGETRARGAAINTESAAATGWNPGFDGPVQQLLLSGNTLITVGDFTRLGLTGANPNPNGPTTFIHGYLAMFDTRPAVTQIKLNANGKPEIGYRDGVGIGTNVDIQFQDALGTPWQRLTTEGVSGIHSPAVDAAGPVNPQRFYRVLVQ